MYPSTSTLVNIYLPSPNALFPEFPFELRPYMVQSPSCQVEWLISPLCKPLADYCLGPRIPCSRGNSKVPKWLSAVPWHWLTWVPQRTLLLALSSESCTENSLTSQSHPSLLSWQSPAQGKRGLMEEEVICNYQEVKILAKITDWLDLNVGKCHLRGPEIWGRLLGIKFCLKQTPEKMTLGILGNWRTTWLTQWGWKEGKYLRNSHF